MHKLKERDGYNFTVVTRVTKTKRTFNINFLAVTKTEFFLTVSIQYQVEK